VQNIIKHSTLWLFLVLGFIPQAEISEASVSNDQIIFPGDELLLDIPTHPELGGVRVVDVRGYLVIDPLDPCLVSRLSTGAAADSLNNAMVKFFRGVEGLKIRILRRQLAVRGDGMVNEPGDYFLPYYAGMEDAIRAAGGIRQGGLMTRVLIQRGESELEVDIRKYRITGNPEVLPTLQTGDRIFVPVSNRDAPVMATLAPLEIAFEDSNVVHVMGIVSNGGTHQMPGKVSLFEALALSGGPSSGANLKNIRITPPGKESYEVNLLDYPNDLEQVLPEITAGTTILVQEDTPGFLKETLTIVAPIVLSAFLIKGFE